MTTFLRVLQEAGEHGVEAVEGVAETAQHGAEQAAGGVPDIGGMLMHHLADAREIELPWGTWVLPHWEPIHLGGLTIDFSPTKHVVFMALAAVIVCVLFLTVTRALRGKYEGQAPSGMANAMEAMIIYFRDEIVRRNIGHGADGYTPFILTLFFFILTMNLLGLVPWGASPTGNIMVTGALAVVTKPTEPWSIYIGSPARKVRDRHRDLLELETLYLQQDS